MTPFNDNARKARRQRGNLLLAALALLVGIIACGSPSAQRVGTETGNLAGDTQGPPWANTTKALWNISVPSPTGSNTALLYNAGAFSWGSAGSTVTWANDLAGSTNTSQTVVGLQSHALPSLPGSQQLLGYSGTAWNFTTPASIFTPGGDLTGNATAQYVQSLSGANAGGTAITLNTVGLSFAANITSPTIKQLTQTTATAPQNTLIQPQFQAGSDEGSAAANTPGSLVINLGAPYTVSHAGNEAFLVQERAGVQVMALGPDPSFPTTDYGFYFGSSTPNGSNWGLLASEDNTSSLPQSLMFLNAHTEVSIAGGTGSAVLFITNEMEPGTDNAEAIGDASHRLASAVAGPTGFEIFHASGASNPTTQVGDALLEFGLGGGSTLDTSIVREGAGQVQVSNGLNGNGQVDVGGTSSANDIRITSSTTTVGVVGTGASGAQSTGLTLSPQTRNAGAGSIGGNITMPFQSPVSTATTIGMLVATLDGTTSAGFGGYGSGYGGVWGGAGPYNQTNYALVANGTQTFVNASTQVYVGFGGGGGATYEFTSSALSPFAAGGATFGTASLPWGAADFGNPTSAAGGGGTGMGFQFLTPTVNNGLAANSGSVTTRYNITATSSSTSGVTLKTITLPSSGLQTSTFCLNWTSEDRTSLGTSNGAITCATFVDNSNTCSQVGSTANIYTASTSVISVTMTLSGCVLTIKQAQASGTDVWRFMGELTEIDNQQ